MANFWKRQSTFNRAAETPEKTGTSSAPGVTSYGSFILARELAEGGGTSCGGAVPAGGLQRGEFNPADSRGRTV